MPYILSVPKSFSVSKPGAVDITRVRIVGFKVDIDPTLQSQAVVELQAGTGPYTAEDKIWVIFDEASTVRILNADPTGLNKVSKALEKAVFDEMAALGKIPAGTVS